MNGDAAGVDSSALTSASIDEVWAAVAHAISSLDGDRVADALVDAVQRLLSPRMLAGFIVEVGQPVELRRFVIDQELEQRLESPPDFGWLEPLLGRHVTNGASVIGPRWQGMSQIAAVMTAGEDRLSYFVIAGDFSNSEAARTQLAAIAREAGQSSQAMRLGAERVADVAALRERERLSRDLHDSLSQSLWSLSMLSETAGSMTNPDDPLHEVVRQIAEISLTSQEEMRSLLINLRTADPSQETVAGALETVVREFRASHDVEVVVSIADADLNAATVMAFRRIAEEALNNVGRHAGASGVIVIFGVLPVVSLRVADNGRGFDAKPLEGHLGLRIMEERAKEIDAAFDVTSTPGIGTIVTASPDLARVGPFPARPGRVVPPSMRRAFRYLVAGVLTVALSGGLLFASSRERSDAAGVQTELDVAMVTSERVTISRASADEAIARILEGVGVGTGDDVERATAARTVAVEDAARSIEPMARSGSVSGESSLRLLGTLSRVAGPDELDDDYIDRLLYEVDNIDRPEIAATPESVTPIHSLGNLAAMDQAVTFSLMESVVVRYARDSDAFDPPAMVRDYFEFVAEFVAEDGGYFGPNPGDPLRRGYIATDIAEIHEGEALQELSSVIARASLWEDDQWVRSWPEESGPAPTSLIEYVERSRTASAAVRGIVDERFDARQMILTSSRDAHNRSALLLAVAALGLLLAGLVLLARSLRTVLQRSRAMAIDSTIDPLTGIGNRKLLDVEVAPRLSDPALRHHVMVTLDMDRFKFINDAHGHGFGDRMLEVVGAGLSATSQHIEGVVGTAIRIGGDEFLVSFHSENTIAVERVHRVLERLRTTLLSADDGTLVRCSFSYGLVAAEGSPDLRSLMASSDLAAYEEKAVR